MTTLSCIESSLQLAVENGHAWSVYPSEAAALLDELKRLREQRALENEDLATAWDKGRAEGYAHAYRRHDMQRVKVYGADLIRFFEEWPPGPDWAISDDAQVAVVDGSLRWVGLLPAEEYPNAPHVQPKEEYTLTHGYLWWQNQQRVSPLGADPILVDVLRRWMRAKEFTTLAVEVPREEVEAFRALCAERKWRVR